MDSVRNRLLCAEEDLLSSVTGDENALQTFDRKWSKLQDDIDTTLQNHHADDNLMTLAHAVASRVAIVADRLLEFHVQSDAMASAFTKELGDIFSALSLSDCNPARSHELSTVSGPSDSSAKFSIHPTVDGPCPYTAHIAPAYKWLLKNIHNPYPTEEIKEAISTKSGLSREIVDDWFIRARKKMGWNALCKKHHAKSRKETLDAAYRFFIAPDPKRPLDGDLEYDFAAVLNAAKAMYSEKLLKSALAAKLDVVVKDMTPVDRARRKEEKQLRKQEKERKTLAPSSYPSPDHTPGHSPDPSLPSLTAEDSDCNISPPEPIAGRKRRSSSSDSSHWACEVDTPNKRQRSDSTSSGGAAITGLPSPPSSSDEALDVQPPLMSSKSSGAPTVPIPSSASRKRRLSDADAQGAPKRPRNLPVGPRVHAVSDPLPMTSTLVDASAFDDWFKVNNFDLPSPAATENDLTSSMPLEVEFFDYSTLYPGGAVESVEKPIPQQFVMSEAVDLFIPSVGGNQADVGQASFVELDTSCRTDFELFEWPLSLDGKENELPVDNVTDLVDKPFDFCSVSPAFDLSELEGTGMGLMTPFPTLHQTSDSAPLPSSDSTNNLDWFDPFLPFSNTESQFYQPNDSQSGYSFDPSVFPFCDVSTTVPGHEEDYLQAEKAEKQRKLRELQEAARKLEEELSVA